MALIRVDVAHFFGKISAAIFDGLVSIAIRYGGQANDRGGDYFERRG